MPVGEGSLLGFDSYAAVGRETTFGTYNTATAALNPLSVNFTTLKDAKLLEVITRERTYNKQLSLGKVIEGNLEDYVRPELDSFAHILQNAFGGTVTSATTAGETTGGGGFDHTFDIGSMDQSYPSLNFNIRKGGSAGAKVFQYSGVRVQEMTFTGEIDEPFKYAASVICKDSTQTSNDVASALSLAAEDCLSFVNGRLSVETAFASLTSTSFWHVQSLEFVMTNNLKSDTGSRRIGSDTLDVLPVGIAGLTLKATIRYDTTTAYDAMLNETQLAAEFEFLGSTISGSVARKGVVFQMPKVFVKNAGDPEIAGPDELLTSEVEFNVLRDDSSAGGYAVRAILTNDTASYA